MAKDWEVPSAGSIANSGVFCGWSGFVGGSRSLRGLGLGTYNPNPLRRIGVVG